MAIADMVDANDLEGSHERLYYCPDGSSEESLYHSGCSHKEYSVSLPCTEDRPVCIGQEGSPIRKSTRSRKYMELSGEERSLRSSTRRSTRKSWVIKKLDSELPTLENSMTESMNSDSSSFMEKPLRHLGVTEHTISKDRRKSLVQQLKRIGKHLHRSKSSNSGTEHTTLAVL